MAQLSEPRSSSSGVGPLTVRLALNTRGDVERVGPYKVSGVLGRGGMGLVYEVVDDAGATFALKIIELRFLEMPESQAGRRFSQEISVLATLDHPSVVRMYEYGYARHPSDQELAFFVMERLHGETLDKLMGRAHVFKETEVARLIGMLAHAVDYLDQNGVTHRDIKPGNIFIDRGDRVVLMDFGLARSEEFTRLTRAGQIIGTLVYMSAERLCAIPSSVKADVYALGVVLYELLTGDLPFDGSEPTDLVEKIKRGPSFPPELHKRPHGRALEALCRAMLATLERDRLDPKEVVRRCLAISPLTPGAKGNEGPMDEPSIEDIGRWRSTGLLPNPWPKIAATMQSSFDGTVATQRESPPTTAPIGPPASLLPRVVPVAPGPGWPGAVAMSALTFALGVLFGAFLLRGREGAALPAPAPAPSAAQPNTSPPPVGVAAAEPTFDDADAAFEYGDRAIKDRHYQPAVRALERAIELNPAHAEAYRRLGDVLLALGEEQAAFKRYATFIKLRPDSPEAVELRRLIPKP